MKYTRKMLKLMQKIQETEINDIKRLSIREFKEEGFLQEVNRLFFHPLGLALEITIDDELAVITGIWDYRDDPEGMLFGPEVINQDKIISVDNLKKSKVDARKIYDDVNEEGIQVE